MRTELRNSVLLHEELGMEDTSIKVEIFVPVLVVQLVGASSCAPKGCRFDFC